MARFRIGVLVGLISGFVVLAVLASDYPYFPFDLPFTQALQGFNGALLPAMAVTSFMGSLWPSIIIVADFAVYLGLRRRRLAAAVTGIATAALSLGIVPALKAAIARPRPVPELVMVIAPDAGGSFPSGHAAFAVLFYGWVIYLLPQLTANRGVIITLRVLLAVFIVVDMLSRVYLGAHWASDVLGGAILGGIALWIMIVTYEILRRRLDGKESHAGAA